MGRLSGKTAFVTAAGQGIGAAIARAFVAEGATVTATDVNAAALDALAAEVPGLRTAPLDVTDRLAVRGAAKAMGAVDALVNCAGWVHHGTILDCDDAAWDRSVSLNVTAMMRMIRAFLPAMLEAGGGAIVNIASVASSQKGVVNRCAYGATKAAVIGLTKSVAADFITQGVRCNAICPGTVESPSLEERIRSLPGDYADNRAAFVARQPMGRIGRAEEIAALAVYLAADESAFMTGQDVRIDGGFTL